MILEEEQISMSFLLGDHIKELTGLMEILGLEEYFKEKVNLWFNLCVSNFHYFQLESMKNDNWKEAFNLPKPSSNKSKSVAGSPAAKSCKSYALLNSPASFSQQRNFDRNERDKYFPIKQKQHASNVDGKFIPNQILKHKKCLIFTNNTFFSQ